MTQGSNGNSSPGKIGIGIAGITIAVTSSQGMKLALDRSLQAFAVELERADVTVQASWGDLASWDSGEKIFDSGDIWQLYREDDSYSFRFASTAFGEVPYKVARFDRDFRTGEVCLHRPYFDEGVPNYPLQYPLDELLILSLLSRSGGAAVHACGIIDPLGNGYLFPGQSGAGKTTMARLWHKHPGAVVLNDERIILRRREGRIWIFGTPWHGEAEFAAPACAPLTGVYFLRHGLSRSVRPIPGAQAAVRLLSCIFSAFHDREGLDFTLQLLEEVIRLVPASDLSVVPDDGMVGYLLSVQ
jgi:hypothetical protein